MKTNTEPQIEPEQPLDVRRVTDNVPLLDQLMIDEGRLVLKSNGEVPLFPENWEGMDVNVMRRKGLIELIAKAEFGDEWLALAVRYQSVISEVRRLVMPNMGL